MKQDRISITATPKDLFEQAHRMLDAGDVWGAASRAGHLRKNLPEEAPLMALNGYTLTRLGSYLPAIAELGGALEITERALREGDPESPTRPRVVEQKLRLMTEMARCYKGLGELVDALELADDALAIEPDRPDTVAARAEVLAELGRHDDAVSSLEDAIQRGVDEARLSAALAHTLLDAPDADPERLASLALRLDSFCNEVGRRAGDLAPLLRAYAGVLDRLGRYDEAFRAARRAAHLRPGEFESDVHAQAADAIVRNWGADEIARLIRPKEHPGGRRVLVLGTHHSGVPRVEALLRRLEGVRVMGPAELLGSLVNKHFKTQPTPLRRIVGSPKGIRGEQLVSLGQEYAEQCDSTFGAGVSRTVDTHPHNLMLAPLAAAALPGLTIIQCRREPAAHTLALYAHEMPGNHAYTRDILETASFVRDTDRLMDHYARALGDERVGARVVDLAHTEILSDPVATLRTLAGVLEIEPAGGIAPDLAPTEDRGIGREPDAYASHLRGVREFFEDPAPSA